MAAEDRRGLFIVHAAPSPRPNGDCRTEAAWGSAQLCSDNVVPEDPEVVLNSGASSESM